MQRATRLGAQVSHKAERNDTQRVQRYKLQHYGPCQLGLSCPTLRLHHLSSQIDQMGACAGVRAALSICCYEDTLMYSP